MKKPYEVDLTAQDIRKMSKLRSFFNKNVKRLREGPLTCPLCREVFPGIADLGKHLKIHCT